MISKDRIKKISTEYMNLVSDDISFSNLIKSSLKIGSKYGNDIASALHPDNVEYFLSKLPKNKITQHESKIKQMFNKVYNRMNLNAKTLYGEDIPQMSRDISGDNDGFIKLLASLSVLSESEHIMSYMDEVDHWDSTYIYQTIKDTSFIFESPASPVMEFDIANTIFVVIVLYLVYKLYQGYDPKKHEVQRSKWGEEMEKKVDTFISTYIVKSRKNMKTLLWIVIKLTVLFIWSKYRLIAFDGIIKKIYKLVGADDKEREDYAFRVFIAILILIALFLILLKSIIQLLIDIYKIFGGKVLISIVSISVLIYIYNTLAFTDDVKHITTVAKNV